QRYVAEMVHGYGISHVFLVPTILTPALAAMGELGITRVTTHGEKAAAYMADGYARASRKPGVCMAQTVGAATLAAGLTDAWLAGPRRPRNHIVRGHWGGPLRACARVPTRRRAG